MTLVILNLSGLDEAGWRPWFEAVLPGEGDWQLAGDPDDPPPADRYVLIYDAPDTRVLRGLRAGAPFEEIIADWRGYARQILARWRKARRSLYLVDADAFAAAPEMLAESLGRWLGRDMGPAPVVDHAADAEPLALLAAQAAHGLDPLRRLADELEVAGMSPRLARQGSMPELTAVYGILREQAAALDSRSDHAKQLARAEAEAKSAQQDKARAQHEAKALAAKLGQAAEKATAAEALFHEEVALLQQQLVTVQQALEREYRDGLALRKEADSDLDRVRRAAELEELRLSTMLREQAEQIAALLEGQRALTTRLDRSREEVDALMASTSWRVTAPLRRARLAVAKPT
ncbi:hypothetical protein AB9K34_21745 [Sedimentitalea sp. XS_ASV28]|uniref:hypothetical protein n=1 Tax=Sedimentitalea sp. XS_ASV28 TaxID=3241296 RepID=UPI0035165198